MHVRRYGNDAGDTVGIYLPLCMSFLELLTRHASMASVDGGPAVHASPFLDLRTSDAPPAEFLFAEALSVLTRPSEAVKVTRSVLYEQ